MSEKLNQGMKKKQRVNKFQAAMDSDEEGVEKLGAHSMK